MPAPSRAAVSYTFETIAGSGGLSSSADGTGAAAGFLSPNAVAVDHSSGNVYVADGGNHTIRRITPAGAVTTVAGSPGLRGSANGTGSAARFYNPSGITVDGGGNIYVADSGNDTIRKITPEGVVTTFAGSPGIAGSDNGTGGAARFSYPIGLAADTAGNVYVADAFNSTIRKITPEGVVSTLAGSAGISGSANGLGGAARFDFPGGVAVDLAGNVYVGDTLNYTIRKISPSGDVTTLAGSAGIPGSDDGTGGAARFSSPSAVGVDAAGNIYVTSGLYGASNHTIRKVTPAGGVTTLAGSPDQSGYLDGSGSAARFHDPEGLTADAAGHVYVADTVNNAIRVITSAGAVTTLAGGSGRPGLTDAAGAAALFDGPGSTATDGAGNIYVADVGNGVLRKITPAGMVTTVAGTGVDGGPDGVTVDGTGNVFFVSGANTIYKITPAGTVVSLYTGTSGHPGGIAADSSGNVYVAYTTYDIIAKITPDGTATILAGTSGAAGHTDDNGSAARFRNPKDVAVDAAGNVYVADAGNYTVRKISPTGDVTTLAGLAETSGTADGTGAIARFADPLALAADGPGNVYVIDERTIRKITPAGDVTTIGGRRNSSDYAAGTGTAAHFSLPQGIAVNGGGFLYVADATYNSILVGSVESAPGITGQPVGQTLTVGQTAEFTVTATGGYVRYQWRKGGVDIDGATAASLTVPSVVLADAGAYDVIVSNLLGSVISDPAALTVRKAVQDFNGDRKADVILQNSSTGERKVWLMNGTARASEVSLGAVSLNWQIVGAADFNGDGQTDILWQNTQTGERGIWLMIGTNVSDWASLGIIPLDWQIAAVADFDGDGQVDLLLENTNTGERKIRLMDGTTPGAEVSLGVVHTEWQIAGAADFNGDGQTDILWQNTRTGERGVWLMIGTNVADWASFGIVPPKWRMVAALDLNGDGQADILWENAETGARKAWLMNGTTLSSEVSLGTEPTAWHLGRWGITGSVVRTAVDFDGDGKMDILWQNLSTGERKVWLMNGTALGSEASLGVVSTAWHIVAAADFNGDGQTDVLWQNTQTGERGVWLMIGTGVADWASLGIIPLDWRIAAVEDFNGDGKVDLVLENTSTGERKVRLMDGTTPGADVSLGVVHTEWQIAGAADFNGDGQADILWQNTRTGDRGIWVMIGTYVGDWAFLGTVPPEWRMTGAVDLNGDGQADILWENTLTGERKAWLMNGTTHTGDVSLGVVPTEWQMEN